MRTGGDNHRLMALIAASCVGFVVLAVLQESSGQSFLALAASPPEPVTGLSAPSPPPQAEPAEQPDRRWSLLAVGDVLMDDTEEAGVDPFAAVSPPLSSGDLTLVNVEMAIASGGEPEDKQFTFRAPPSAASTLARAGVDVANLANNHTLDYGLGALFDTVRHLTDAGVAPVGAGEDAEEAYRPVVFNVRETRVAVLGASRVLPWMDWAAGGWSPGLASGYDEPALVAAVAKTRKTADVVIVAVHWGTEMMPCPDDDVAALGLALVDAGATVVLGSHPHVLQPVVRYNGGLIAYSLGNFVFNQRTSIDGDTGVLEIQFDGSRLVDHQLHPHRIDQGPPRPADPADSARIERAVDPAACAF